MIPIIKDSNPNTICITGDIVETSKDDHTCVLKSIEEVSSLYRTYYVPGNHDESYKNKRWKHDKNWKLHCDLKKIGIKLLETGIPVVDNDTNVCFNGYNIPYEYYNDQNQDKFQELYNLNIHEETNDHYNILLTHVDKLKRTRNELVLSGHFHNGVIKLPFNAGLIRPGNGIFPFSPIQLGAHGVIKRYNSIHIINGALSKVRSNFVNTILHPDLVVIDLVPYPVNNQIINKEIVYKKI
jgi:Predicted phosphohydrolases